jgi:hypothetical protein
MVANVGMVGRRCLLGRGIGGRQKEEVCGIRLSQSHEKTSYRRHFALVEYIGWAITWARSVVGGDLGFFCSAACSHCGLIAGSLHVFVVGMRKTILHVSRGLQDVSLASCLWEIS